ncbi:DNA polymerase IV [Frankia sp. CNm7]|uniref:DNA polymerase IV n=1 Tax=Frankia nepalensis TaxID=1836974 RepID=A0A937RP17_9ACTN|nr:DNA polymerase IV [Frankia nepalensis]MBL7501606.1 DNA polymerase IV [Frankia nepalensis]MBL7513387.1 DNA polymerase IV [Frankia nepalensis]MBL7521060.1 DNA polymerase IV [Frankia nepalensis]MBL7633695.1 DNA polymerase IV [Frankia nepalensis]
MTGARGPGGAVPGVAVPGAAAPGAAAPDGTVPVDAARPASAGETRDGPARDGSVGSPILHVDMDAFFAAVTLLGRPELRGRPVIIGGGPRGVVLSATYGARAFGVRSAMPIARARRLCPAALVLPPERHAYQEVSGRVMAILRDVTPLVAPLSVDEAFLDVSGARRLFGTPAEIAGMIRARVLAQEGLTCSVGVAPTMFVAKIASTRCKPDGLLVVEPDRVLDFLHPLPTSALWGVGRATEAALDRLGLRTIGDIADCPPATLRRALGQAAGAHLWALAHGRDERAVDPGSTEVSIGAEHTLAVDTADLDVLARELLRLSGQVARRLRGRGWAARTVAVKIRLADFTTLTRARTLREPTDVTQEIYRAALALFRESGTAGSAVRLVGVRAAGLVDAGATGHQLALDERPSGWSQLERAADAAGRRFGTGAVAPASLLPREPRQPGDVRNPPR